MIIGGKRKCGKTTRAILKSNEIRATIVTASRDMAKCIEIQAKVMGLEIPKPIAYDELISMNKQGGNCDVVIVDEIEWLLKKMLGVKEIALSTTTEIMEELESRDFKNPFDINGESLYSKAKRLHKRINEELTDEEKEIIKWLDAEILSCAEVGYDRIDRLFTFEEHGDVKARRVALNYDKQGFRVEVTVLTPTANTKRFEISIGWGE